MKKQLELSAQSLKTCQEELYKVQQRVQVYIDSLSETQRERDKSLQLVERLEAQINVERERSSELKGRVTALEAERNRLARGWADIKLNLDG
jgi:chromosome segregation ATPase